ncbi:MAG: hypothetical protein JWO13_1606 [Acidobacteriales bacterium]|nr:hypothetical protein [Terriglobales bacterium]
MKRLLLLFLALSSACLSPHAAFAGTRPRYGGSAHVQVKETLTSLDVIATRPNTFLRQQLAMLLFDRLTQLDEHGLPQSSLAISWTSDSQHRVWQFRLRPGVIFHDGSPLTAALIASCITTAEPDWKVTAPSSQTVVIETDSASPNLPAIVSAARFSIYSHDSDAALIGTGAFKIGEFLTNRRLLLSANDDYWGGRPYLDALDVQMGNSIREQLIDRRLDRDDVVELSLDQARTLGWTPAGSATQHLAASAASDVYAIYFFRADPISVISLHPTTPGDRARIREALALTIDRIAIASVLLQRQGEPALALLPQWLTGYEFLFPSTVDVDRARKLRLEAAKNSAIAIPLAYDAGDNVARAIAERVAVNAREANITVQPFGEKNVSIDTAFSTSAQAVLVKLPTPSLDSALALFEFAKVFGVTQQQESTVLGATTPESLYAAERDLLQDFRIIPIAHVPEIFWLNPRLKNWAQPREGGWRMQDVWLENDRPASSGSQR